MTNKTEAKHTPTPWEVDSRGILQSVSKHIESIDPLSSGTGVKMVQEGIGRISMVLNPSNAAFIVQAVNAHDALVEALKGVEAFWNMPSTVKADGMPVRLAVQAALKLAGVK